MLLAELFEDIDTTLYGYWINTQNKGDVGHVLPVYGMEGHYRVVEELKYVLFPDVSKDDLFSIGSMTLAFMNGFVRVVNYQYNLNLMGEGLSIKNCLKFIRPLIIEADSVTVDIFDDNMPISKKHQRFTMPIARTEFYKFVSSL